jgi:hypothetical protein
VLLGALAVRRLNALGGQAGLPVPALHPALRATFFRAFHPALATARAISEAQPCVN